MVTILFLMYQKTSGATPEIFLQKPEPSKSLQKMERDISIARKNTELDSWSNLSVSSNFFFDQNVKPVTVAYFFIQYFRRMVNPIFDFDDYYLWIQCMGMLSFFFSNIQMLRTHY